MNNPEIVTVSDVTHNSRYSLHYSYQSLTNAEQHFYPSSLAFDLTCLLDAGIVTCANLGFQRKV